MSRNYWLVKAEPDSRIVKGKDVKFSVDDFEAVGTSPWEGVRNYEARNLMKEMRTGDQLLFYHSNCKLPGVAAFAEVSREAYPDYTAWDSAHPYYDPKSDQKNPKWFMVDVKFKSRASNFIPLGLIKEIATLSKLPSGIAYIGGHGVKAIKGMALINKGRLSVQRVDNDAWVTIKLLAERGGWDDISWKGKRKAAPQKVLKTNLTEGGDVDQQTNGPELTSNNTSSPLKPFNGSRKRKATTTESCEAEDNDTGSEPTRKSTRNKKRK